MTAQTLCDQALLLHQRGQLAEAERLYRRAMADEPAAFLPRHLLGILALQQGHGREALDLIGRALEIEPGNAAAMINYGNALKLAGRHEEALESFARALASQPDMAGGPYNRAILLADLGRHDEALANYAQAAVIRPDFFEALYERALLLQRLERPDEALVDFGRALALRPQSAEGWNNRGVALLATGDFDDALVSFGRALAIHPASAEALHNRGNALAKLKRPDEALKSCDRALAIKPKAYAEAWTNRATLLRDMRRFAEARISLDRALAIDPDFAAALYHRGNLVWTEFRDYHAALADLERLVTCDPDHPYAQGDLLYLKMQGGDWRGRQEAIAAIDKGVRAGKPVIEPFIYQAVSESPADLKICAEHYAQRRYPARPQPSDKRRPPERQSGKIRIGYVSGEFREQATAHLTAGLYEAHDRSRFEVFAFDNGMSDGSAMRQRLEAAFDGFIAIAQLPDREAAEKISGAEIDILVNLNGYFGEKRMGVFARKPAPVQVNFLGFPGTLGADYMDYIIADAMVIPEGEERHYREKVVRLPGSYQVNDDRRAIAADMPSRADCGLPPEGFVFCCFNQCYKITPETFAGWMRILLSVPDSVLWLLQGHTEFAANIRRAVERAGVAATRIVFAPLIAADKHLARLKLADLFLDTMPCNAHTTASDALWAGVPLVTCQGHAFSGRVAASLLHAVGLPELVTENPPAYEAMARALAGDPARLGSVKTRLAQNRDTRLLFDTDAYRRHLETAYIAMQERRERGLPAASFSVK